MPILTKLSPKQTGTSPAHIAISTGKLKAWGEKNGAPAAEAVQKHLKLVKELIEYQTKNELPVMTLQLPALFSGLVDAYKSFFKKMLDDDNLETNQVRVLIIGNWYSLDPALVELFKKIMEKTKDYDKQFLNLCIKYDGQEELAAAIRLVVRKIIAGKMSADDVSKATIKDSIYTSYFTPPDLIIENSNVYSGLLLWDSKGACIYYTKKLWLDFETHDLQKALKFYAEGSGKTPENKE